MRRSISAMLFHCSMIGGSCSDLHIPEGPAWTNQTAEEEGLSHPEWLLSPASSPSSPSPTSQLPFSAAWSEVNEKVRMRLTFLAQITLMLGICGWCYTVLFVVIIVKTKKTIP